MLIDRALLVGAGIVMYELSEETEIKSYLSPYTAIYKRFLEVYNYNMEYVKEKKFHKS